MVNRILRLPLQRYSVYVLPPSFLNTFSLSPVGTGTASSAKFTTISYVVIAFISIIDQHAEFSSALRARLPADTHTGALPILQFTEK